MQTLNTKDGLVFAKVIERTQALHASRLSRLEFGGVFPEGAINVDTGPMKPFFVLPSLQLTELQGDECLSSLNAEMRQKQAKKRFSLPRSNIPAPNRAAPSRVNFISMIALRIQGPEVSLLTKVVRLASRQCCQNAEPLQARLSGLNTQFKPRPMGVIANGKTADDGDGAITINKAGGIRNKQFSFVIHIPSITPLVGGFYGPHLWRRILGAVFRCK